MEIFIRDSKCFKMPLIDLMQRGTIQKQRFEIRALKRATVVGEPYVQESHSLTSPTAALLRSCTVYRPVPLIMIGSQPRTNKLMIYHPPPPPPILEQKHSTTNYTFYKNVYVSVRNLFFTRFKAYDIYRRDSS